MNDKPALRPGDPVTIIQSTFVACGEVHTSTKTSFRFDVEGSASGAEFLLADEGVTWVRGHAIPGAEAVRAAQTASGLRGLSVRPDLPFGLPAPMPSGIPGPFSQSPTAQPPTPPPPPPITPMTLGDLMRRKNGP